MQAALKIAPTVTVVTTSPGAEIKPILAERYKTKMCKNFEQTGVCPYEVRCMFAHGDCEMRTKEMNLRDGLVSEDAIRDFRRAQMATPSSQGKKSGSKGSPKGSPKLRRAAPPSISAPAKIPIVLPNPMIKLGLTSPIKVTVHTPVKVTIMSSPSVSPVSSMAGLSRSATPQSSGMSMQGSISSPVTPRDESISSIPELATLRRTVTSVGSSFGGKPVNGICGCGECVRGESRVYTHNPYNWGYAAICACEECVRALEPAECGCADCVIPRPVRRARSSIDATEL